MSFNPRAPCGARQGATCQTGAAAMFQSTRPVWGATRRWKYSCRPAGVSIHAPRVGRDGIASSNSHTCKVSIHAPRVGRDEKVDGYGVRISVSIHAPRVGRDDQRRRSDLVRKFQSTRPVWGATFSFMNISRRSLFQSTRPVWGATHRPRSPSLASEVSIHAPRVGRDGDAG